MHRQQHHTRRGARKLYRDAGAYILGTPNFKGQQYLANVQQQCGEESAEAIDGGEISHPGKRSTGIAVQRKE